MTSTGPSSRPPGGGRRGLTREAIVWRALEIGDQEVSVRRVASDLGVTPMALYRHVRDKNDLHNAMLEAVIAGADLSAGIKPTMPWQQQTRGAPQNAVDLLTARPVTLPLQIAYQGPLTPGIAPPVRGVARHPPAGGVPSARCGRARSDASDRARRAAAPVPGGGGSIGQEERDWLRRQVELQVLDLPADEFPLMRRHARLIGETVLPDTNRWLRQAIDLIVDGLEATLDRQTKRGGG